MLNKPYSRGAYNCFNDIEQYIRISEGCPNGCKFCYESLECGATPVYFEIPDIIRNQVKIMDMNLIYKPKALQIIKDLGRRRVNNKVIYYELICGIDYRYLNQEIADALKANRFINIRFAWDNWVTDQQKIKKCVNMLLKAGYNPVLLSCFIICNWVIPYEDNLKKLDLLKVWNIKVNDCWFDNQLSPNIKPLFWEAQEIKDFRAKCRKHNQLVRFGIDPELKEA